MGFRFLRELSGGGIGSGGGWSFGLGLRKRWIYRLGSLVAASWLILFASRKLQ
jgi:hypothetical protein